MRCDSKGVVDGHFKALKRQKLERVGGSLYGCGVPRQRQGRYATCRVSGGTVIFGAAVSAWRAAKRLAGRSTSIEVLSCPVPTSSLPPNSHATTACAFPTRAPSIA